MLIYIDIRIMIHLQQLILLFILVIQFLLLGNFYFL